VDLGRIIDRRIDPSLEEILEVLWLGMGLVEVSREEDVEESWDMTDVEKILVSKIDRLLQQHLLLDHPQRDPIPERP
jgi:hypothetical protein